MVGLLKFGVHPEPVTPINANVLLAVDESLSSSKVISSLPTFNCIEPLLAAKSPAATVPTGVASNDAFSFVNVTDTPPNIFTGDIVTESE